MADTPAQTGYARVTGLDIYHEIHGTGEPLVLPEIEEADVFGYSMEGGVAKNHVHCG